MREIRNKCVYLQRYIQANFQKLRRGAALGSVTPFRYSSPSAPLLGAAHLSLDFRLPSLLDGACSFLEPSASYLIFPLSSELDAAG